MEADLVAKIVSMCILGGVSLILGLLPMKLVEKYNLKEDKKSNSAAATADKSNSKVATFKQLVLTALNCFGAGVILTTCFAHMLPEANDSLKRSNIKTKGLALGNVFMICGFLMIYIVEELADVIVQKLKDDDQTKTKPKPKCGLTKNVANVDEDLYDQEDPLKISYEPEKKTKANSSEISSDEDDCANCDKARIPNSKLRSLIPDDFQAIFRGFMVVLAISLHAIFEGIAMGTLGKASVIWYLCFAISAHKFIIAFCVGMQLASSGMKNFLIVIYISTFSLITPIGIGIGIAVTESSNLEGSSSVAILQALAAGTLVYVVYFEVLEKEREKKRDLDSNTQSWRQLYGVIQVSFIVLGFIVMILVQLLEGDHHHHHMGKMKQVSVCEINPTEVFLNISTVTANVTCQNEKFEIL